jgi:fatty acid amide hydrolase
MAGRELAVNVVGRFGSVITDPTLRKRFAWSVVGATALLVFSSWRKYQLVQNSRQIAKKKREQRDERLAIVEEPTEEERTRFLEIGSLPTQELIKRLQSGEVTAVEALKCYIYLAKKAQARFNCLADVLFDEAMRQAQELDETFAKTGPVGPLHGLPLSIKDNISAKGGDATIGVAKNCFIERDDSVLCQVLKEAGAVIFAKTNIPQTLLTFETSNPVWGRTFNPWNINRTPGGSSGGEAALLAAAGSPLGFGSDIGGSVRLPCHFCGLYGLKATATRISTVGAVSSVKGQESVVPAFGPMGTSVEDLVSLLRPLWSDKQFGRDSDCGAPLYFNEDMYLGQKPLRIGYYLYDGWFEPSNACKRAVVMAVEALKARGHEVIEIEPPNVKQIIEAYYFLMTADGGAHLWEYLEGEELDPLVPHLLRLNSMPSLARATLHAVVRYLMRWNRMADLLQQAGAKSVSDVWKMQYFRKKLKRGFVEKWRAHNLDVLLTPGLSTPAIPHNFAKDLTPSLSYTMIWNIFDFPAGIAPMTTVTKEDLANQPKREVHGDMLDKCADRVDQNSEGLPVGCQVVTLPWQDELALRVMRELEEAVPFEEGQAMRAELVASYLQSSE